MPLARVIYPSSTAGVAEYSVPFDYISTADVVVLVDDVSVAYTWLSASTISLTVTPPAGSRVVVRRYTENTDKLVDFVDGSTLTETDLDLSATQVFYLAQETMDDAEESLATAIEARQRAQEAETVANAANTKADNALTAAAAADAKADTVIAGLNKAKDDAAAALLKADEALTKSTAAESKASAAELAATEATTAANTATTTANTALDTANTANQSAVDLEPRVTATETATGTNTTNLNNLTTRVTATESDIAALETTNYQTFISLNEPQPTDGVNNDLWLQYE